MIGRYQVIIIVGLAHALVVVALGKVIVVVSKILRQKLEVLDMGLRVASVVVHVLEVLGHLGILQEPFDGADEVFLLVVGHWVDLELV